MWIVRESEPEVLAEAFGELLLLLDKSGGGGCIHVVSSKVRSGGEVIGILHGGLEGCLVESNHLIGHTGGSDNAAGRAKPLVIVALLTEGGNVGVLGKSLSGERSENLNIGAANDIGGLCNTPVSLFAEQGCQLVSGVALGQVGVGEVSGAGESLSADVVGSLSAVGGGNSVVLLGVSDKTVNVLETVLVSADDDERGLGYVVADSGEVSGGVIAELLDDGAVEVGRFIKPMVMPSGSAFAS